MFTNRMAWLDADLADRTAIRNILTGTGGLELYFVNSFIDIGATAAYNAYGIVVTSNANFRTLAHEIGHACGWRDIYESAGGYAVSGLVRSSWSPSDWNAGPGPQYYRTTLLQEDMILRLLMYGTFSTTKASIPNGAIHGVWYQSVGGAPLYHLNLAPVGRAGMNRNPSSL
jgi:hypothetical protein